MRRKTVPIPANGAAFAAAWCFAFLGSGTCSGAMMVPSGPSAGAASTTFGGSAADGNPVSGETDGAAGVEAVRAASVLAAEGGVGLTAGAMAKVGAAALAGETSAEPAAADETAAGAGAGAFAIDVVG